MKKLKRKDFVWKVGHPSESFDLLESAIKKFGIYVYDDPAWGVNSDYAFIVSERKLSKDEIEKVSRMLNPHLWDDD